MLSLNAELGERLKADGMQAALEHSGPWQDDITAEFAAWAAKQKASGARVVAIEDFRAQAVNHPISHKAWGAAPQMFCKAGLIARATDASGSPRYVRAAAPKTHGHPVSLWCLL